MNQAPIMYTDVPGFEKCQDIFKLWIEHKEFDYSPEQQAAMMSDQNESVAVPDFFTPDEFAELTSYFLKDPVWHLFWEGGSSLLNINPDVPNYKRIMELTVDRMRDMHGYFHLDNLFVRKALNSLELHSDNVYNFAGRTPKKTYCIPLAVERNGTYSDDWSNVGTVVMNQFQYSRSYGGDIFNVIGDTGKEFDDTEYELMSHIPKEQLHGLSIQEYLPWHQREVLMFDSYRIHSSSDWSKHGVDAKWCLVVQSSIDTPSS